MQDLIFSMWQIDAAFPLCTAPILVIRQVYIHCSYALWMLFVIIIL